MLAARDQLAIKEEAAPQENELNFYIKSKLMADGLSEATLKVPSVILRLEAFLVLEIPVSS